MSQRVKLCPQGGSECKEVDGVRRCQDGVLECRFKADMCWLGRRLKTQGLESPGERSQSHEVGVLVLRTLGFGAAVMGVQVLDRLSSEVDS